MNLAAIPHHRERSANLPFELSQEIDNVFAMHIVRQQIKVQVHAPCFGADRDTTYGRDAIPTSHRLGTFSLTNGLYGLSASALNIELE